MDWKKSFARGAERLRAGDWPSAMEAFAEAQDAAGEPVSRYGAQLGLALAATYQGTREAEAARALALEASALGRSDLREQALAHAVLASALMDSDPAEALGLARRGLGLLKETPEEYRSALGKLLDPGDEAGVIPSSFGLADALLAFGRALIRADRRPEAMRALQAARAQVETGPSPRSVSNRLRLLHIGLELAAAAHPDLATAEEGLQLALSMADAARGETAIRLLFGYAGLLHQTGRADKALTLLDEGLAQYAQQRLNQPQLLAELHAAAARVNLHRGATGSADQHLRALEGFVAGAGAEQSPTLARVAVQLRRKLTAPEPAAAPPS